MLYAKVALGLAVDELFDYIVPVEMRPRIKPGARVWVNFRGRKILGYVIRLVTSSGIKKLKAISELIDETPLLDKDMLLLALRIADYYCSSRGEVIEAMLPDKIRRGSAVLGPYLSGPSTVGADKPIAQKILLHSLKRQMLWDKYIEHIKEVVSADKSVIVICPDKEAAWKAKERLACQTNFSVAVLCRGDSVEFKEWLKAFSGKARVVVGSRSAVFAPLDNLGLMIIDEEEHYSYKQQQPPHYHAREAAMMRSEIEGCRLILGSLSPSLEAVRFAKERDFQYLFLADKGRPLELQVIKPGGFSPKNKNRFLFSRYTQDSILSVLNSAGKVLLFFNRKGFATSVFCGSCGVAMRCPRCNKRLVFYFREALLHCPTCNFKTKPPELCPSCNAGYLRYSGMGSEKVESELSRIFPQARIAQAEAGAPLDKEKADIFVATQAIASREALGFDLVVVLGVDAMLNRFDFRCSEKAFALLVRLLSFSEKKIIIETRLGNHHIFKSLIRKDTKIFYDEELKQRKEFKFPPYRHFAVVMLRGHKQDKVKAAAQEIFDRLAKNKGRDIQVISVSAAPQIKLRGNFYWQVLTRAKDAFRLSRFLRKNLEKFSASDIIVSVDMDPQ